MNKKENRISVRQVVEKAVIRDEQNRRIEYAATNPTQDVLKEMHTTLCGLDEEAVSASRARYGSNKVTHEKKNRWQGGWRMHLSTPSPPSCSFWHWCPS